MSTKTTQTPAPSTTCACGPYEVCLGCAPEDLATLVQLKMSFHWAQSPKELRERMGAREHLVATASNN